MFHLKIPCFVVISSLCLFAGCGQSRLPDEADKLAKSLGGSVGRHVSENKPVMIRFPYAKLNLEVAEKIANLKTINYLILEGAETPPERLSSLVALKHLPRFALDVRAAESNDIDMRVLASLEMPFLESLWLKSPGLTDKSVDHIVRLVGLKNLVLQQTALTDGGVRRILEKHKGLLTLDLEGAKVTDQLVPDLLKLQGIQWLGLEGSLLTDTGFKKLVELDNLVLMKVGNTAVTEDAQREFRKAKPNCRFN